MFPKENVLLFGHIINPLLTKPVWSRWLNIGLVLFCVFIDLDEKKRTWKISTDLTPLLDNNAHIFTVEIVYLNFYISPVSSHGKKR